jgi:ABC-type bacteriocin/lantibiotic exporter with double-glycine peptidase domain
MRRSLQVGLVPLGVLLALGLPSCGILLGSANDPIDLDELSPRAVVLELPELRQDEQHTCGLVALDVLCAYWGVALPEPERLALRERAQTSAGLSGAELCAVLERAGFDAFVFAGTLDRGVSGLLRHVDRGRPPLVLIAPDGEDFHYCLVAGYDVDAARPERDAIVIQDPARGLVAFPRATLESWWERAGRFTLLAVPRSAGEDPGAAGRIPSVEERP